MSRIVAVTGTTVPEGGQSSDSDTRLLRVRVNAAYINALKNAGLIPIVIPPFEGLKSDEAEALLKNVTGLVLTGGEDVDPAFFGEEPHPKLGEVSRPRDESELALIKEAARRKLPTLAICRGIQILNVALGGTLIQDIPSQIPGAISHKGIRDQRTHEISIEPDSLTASVIGDTKIKVNSSHHQSIGKIAQGLRVTATAGDGVIEAAESTDKNWWVLGVQWHPEELAKTGVVGVVKEPWDKRIFEAFAKKITAV